MEVRIKSINDFPHLLIKFCKQLVTSILIQPESNQGGLVQVINKFQEIVQ